MATIALAWRQRSTPVTEERAAWPRVLLAFYVDLAVYVTATTAPLCLLALVLESSYVDNFAWQFTRDFSRPTDPILTAISIPLVACGWGAFGIPLFAFRESPGGLAARVQLSACRPTPFWRCAVFGLLKYFGAAAPIFEFFAGRFGGFSVRATPAAYGRAA